jgi:hypothetical protein
VTPLKKEIDRRHLGEKQEAQWEAQCLKIMSQWADLADSIKDNPKPFH